MASYVDEPGPGAQKRRHAEEPTSVSEQEDRQGGHDSDVRLASDFHTDNGHRFGNFPNYYSFHNVEDRLDLLTKDLISPMLDECGDDFTIADIGCNDGTLTKALHEKVVTVVASRGLTTRVRTLGLELDPQLVARARSTTFTPGNGSEICFEDVDATDEARVSALASSFLGPSSTRINLVTCFSTTMWVHVNHGDATFLAFLDHLKRLSQRLVIEPQPWRCYRSAATRLRRMGKSELVCYEAVAARSDKVIENFIVRAVCGFSGSAAEAAATTTTASAAEATMATMTATKKTTKKTTVAGPEAEFGCVVLSDAAGSWERKVLLFERGICVD